MAKQVIQAPPSDNYSKTQRVNRVKVLRAKSNASRSAAETKELIDALIALLPPDTLT
jgi:hypothetical protein